MVTRLFITIDTEEDLWGEFRPANNPVANVLRLPQLQSLFKRYGAIPTYLVNWAVVDNEAAVDALRRLGDMGEHEIGTHCHPWHTPPVEEELSAHNSMLCNLPPELVWKKLQNLHERIVDRLGVTPTSFRAGRWGFGGDVAACLQKLGYAIDTSVLPTVDWSAQGGPDYSGAPSASYRFDPSDILRSKADGGLLEVPATVGFWQGQHRVLTAARKRLSGRAAAPFHVLGILDRLGVLNHRWLSPEHSSARDMIRLARTFAAAGCRELNMFFHSNSLIPGLGPFVRSEADLAEFLRRIGVFIEYAATSGFEFAPLCRALDPERPT